MKHAPKSNRKHASPPSVCRTTHCEIPETPFAFSHLFSFQGQMKTTLCPYRHSPLHRKLREKEEQKEKDRENRAHGGSWEGGRKRSFLPPSQRSPRAHNSLPQSSNIFIALACSPAPLKNPREPLQRRQVTSCIHRFSRVGKEEFESSNDMAFCHTGF